MKQSVRREEYDRKNSGNAMNDKPEYLGKEYSNSEVWIDLNYSSKVEKTISDATEQFKNKNGIKVISTDSPIEFNGFPYGTFFKYGGSGELEYCLNCISSGEGGFVVLAFEEEKMIGYGVVEDKTKEQEVKIIDVDLYSTRKNGLYEPITIGDSEIRVGVGHAIVKGIVEFREKPLFVDATNKNSRYIFKSFGFLQDRTVSNPCLLRLV